MPTDRHSYIEFYFSDWVGGTSQLTPMQEWVLLQISLYNWDRNEPVPEKKLPMVFSRHPGWQDDLDFLIDTAEKVIRNRGGSLYNPRALAAAKKASDLYAKRSKGGKATSKKPHKKQKPAQQSFKSAGANQNQNQNIPKGISPYSPPDQIDDELWRDFLKARKVQMTDRAYSMICNKVESAIEQGINPIGLFERAIESGWRTIFLPDNNGRSGDGFQSAVFDGARS